MLANMATSLIIHKKIKTTVAKAKALRTYIEPLITKSKEDSTHSRRVVFGYLQNKDAVSELFREVSPKIMERPGGYTRILKIGNRVGDNAEMCIIELVDYNENLLAAKAEIAAKTGKRRRRGGGKKKEETATQPSTAPEEKADVTAPKEETETPEPEEKVVTQEPEAKVESEEPTDKAEIQEPEKEDKAETPEPEEKVVTQEPEAKVESEEPTDKAEIREPEKKDDQSLAAETEIKETGDAKEETADKPSQETPPEKIQEVKEEKEQDDVKDEDKKE
jgi:large subunit ribosomal protein L17